MQQDRIDFEIFRHEELVTGIKQHPWSDLLKNTRHSFYMIMFTGKNGATHYIVDQEITIAPHSVLFLGPNRKSRFSKEVAESTHVLLFSPLFYNRTTRDAHWLNSSPLFHTYEEVYQLTPPNESIQYCKTMAHLLYIAKNDVEAPLNLDLAHNLIEQILIMGTIYGEKDLKSCYKSGPDQVLVTHYKKLISEHYQTKSTVKFYAEKLNVSERQLNKATNEILHMTAKDVITEHIMEEARWRLIHAPAPIKEISVELGFSGEHNFSAFFKRNENISPLQYRRQKQKNLGDPQNKKQFVAV